ncbi:MAG TPA: hypothetical protein VFA59_16620 [Vicinamibacterales bacterium]|nr:hypothetical protein [Vicinamibacterales bacterium]
MNKTMTSFVIAVAVCVSAIHARAQKPETDPDAAEYKAYRLTMSTLTKIEAATKQYIATMKTDPKYKAMMEQKDGPLSGLGDTNQSLTESAAEMDKFPPIANALKANGLTSREYVKFVGVLFQAYMVSMSGTVQLEANKQAAKDKDPNEALGGAVAAGFLNMFNQNLAPENVTFCKINKPAVERLMQVMGEMGQQ